MPGASSEIPIILNPRARSTRAGERIELLRALSPRARILETSAAGEARSLAAGLARDGFPRIAVAGGDGTVNEVVNGLADAGLERGTALGILPSGTMNVFARELGVYSMDLATIWTAIESGNPRPVDLWRADGHHFVQVAGVGLDADIIEHTTWEMKMRFGPLSYIMAALREIKRFNKTVRIEAEGQPPMEAAFVLVGNGKLYGGPFKLFPEARLDDHLLDVLVLEQHGFRSVARVLQGFALSRSYQGLEGVRYFQTRSMTARSTNGSSVPVEVDGDLCNATPVSFRLAPLPLPVLAPDAP